MKSFINRFELQIVHQFIIILKLSVTVSRLEFVAIAALDYTLIETQFANLSGDGLFEIVVVHIVQI